MSHTIYNMNAESTHQCLCGCVAQMHLIILQLPSRRKSLAEQVVSRGRKKWRWTVRKSRRKRGGAKAPRHMVRCPRATTPEQVLTRFPPSPA